MKRKHLWGIVAFIAGLSLVITACGGQTTAPATTTAPGTTAPGTTAPTATVPPITVTPSAEKPLYGGTMNRYFIAEPTWDLLQFGKHAAHMQSHEYLWDGDWTLGQAGGYGKKQFTWTESVNIPDLNVGTMAESAKWTVDTAKQEVVTKIIVRQGVHFSLDRNSEASRLANGREVDADDVVFCMNEYFGNPDSMLYKLFPSNRTFRVTKTGPWEITMTLPFKEHLAASMRILGLTIIYPPEVYQKYKAAFSDWKNDVGTGPYMITDYVVGSMIQLKRNPNYWMKDPIGPGKGQQLPYIENVKYFVIPDPSTREAALRSAKLDQLAGFTPEDGDAMAKQVPALKRAPGSTFNIAPAYMRTDMKPTSDIKVRRALMMATDFNAINNSLYRGQGQIISWPTWKAEGYEGIYLGLDDPEMPASVKELYTYNPEKAKQLLAEAGYPNGLKTTITLTNAVTTIDYYSIIKGQWSKVGVDLTLELKDPGQIVPIAFAASYKELFSLIYAPPSTWPEQTHYTNLSNWLNASKVDDPIINEAVEKSQSGAVTDFQGSMKITKDLMKYVLDQAYVIPTPRYPQSTMYWPWLKNYSGETNVGYFGLDSWVRYIWIDQELKRSMGH